MTADQTARPVWRSPGRCAAPFRTPGSSCAGRRPAGRSPRAAADGLALRSLGWRSDVETVYAAADLVLLTSDNEGMPVSLIEAGLAGRPAVATDVGSVAEVVGTR